MLPPDLAADVMALHPQRKRRVHAAAMLPTTSILLVCSLNFSELHLQGRPVLVEEGEGDISSMSDGRWEHIT